MSFYSLQASYTPVAWTALVNAPANRVEAERPVVEKLGGRIVNGWFSFGKYDDQSGLFERLPRPGFSEVCEIV